MKKRVKLLTTIASLCLAVALMAFGVYAAAVTDLKVTGSVNFTSTEIDGSWALKSVMKGAEDITPAEGTDLGALSLKDGDTIVITATFTNTTTTTAALSATLTKNAGGDLTATTVTKDGTAKADAEAEDVATDVEITITFNALDKEQSYTGRELEVTFHAQEK